MTLLLLGQTCHPVVGTGIAGGGGSIASGIAGGGGRQVLQKFGKGGSGILFLEIDCVKWFVYFLVYFFQKILQRRVLVEISIQVPGSE